MADFHHRRLDVYDDAVHFAADVYKASARLPFRCRSLADQLFRAATSIALNIAEGSAEWRPAEQVRFYRMARRSAAECAAAAEILHRIQVGRENTMDTVRQGANRIAGRLTRLIQYVESKPSSTSRRSPALDSRLPTPDSRLEK